MKNFDDYISLIIGVVAVLYSIIQVARSIYGTKPENRRYEDEEDDDEGFEEVKKKPKAPPAAPQPAIAKQAEKPFAFHSQLDDFATKTSIEDRHLDVSFADSEGAVVKRPKKPTIQELVAKLPQKKMLFLSYEVFSVPVSRRKTPFPWNG